MTEIAVREDLSPTTPEAAARLVEWAKAAQAAHQLATALASTAFVPQQYRGKPGEATAAILAGAELGFDPLASLRAFDNIQGTVAPKAITLRAVAQSKGHEIEVVEESDNRAVVTYRRAGSDNWREVEWTIEQARNLGLAGKDNWKRQPRAMLVARATAEAARRVASDAILGIAYSSEELRDSPDRQSQQPRRVTAEEIVRPKRQAPALEAGDLDTGEAITPPQLQKLQIVMGENGMRDRDDRLRYLSRVVGRDITTSKELTKAEASEVIDALEQAPDEGAWPDVTPPGDAA